MTTLTQHLWRLFLFTFPFSLGGVVYERAAYRFGNFNPWVAGVLYLPEFLLFLTFLLWSIDQIRQTKEPLRWGGWSGAGVLFLLFILNAGVVTFWKGNGVLFAFFLLRVMEAGMIYLLLREAVIPRDKVIRWLLFGALFQVFLAFSQWRLNHSLGLHFLGEPHLSPDALNVAKNDLPNGTKAIRGYGTFLHPNVLGAYLMTIFFVCLPYLKRLSLPVWGFVLLGGMFISASQAAWLTTIVLLVCVLLMRLFKAPQAKKWLSFGLFGLLILSNLFILFRSGSMVSTDDSIAERFQQNQMALEMVQEHPLGVGVGNFTLQMERFSDSKLAPWEFLPVHNVYFLLMAEVGLQGLLLLVGMIILMLGRYFKTHTDYSLESTANVLPFMGLVFIASFDHLLLTSYVGFWLVALVLVGSEGEFQFST